MKVYMLCLCFQCLFHPFDFLLLAAERVTQVIGENLSLRQQTAPVGLSVTPSGTMRLSFFHCDPSNPPVPAQGYLMLNENL